MKAETNFKINNGVKIETYMYKIVLNKIKHYHHIRKKNIQFEEIEDYNFIDDSEEYDYKSEENLKRLRTVIFNLPSKYKLICIWFFVERKSIKDISLVLNMNENTIKSRIHNAKKIIKKKLC